MRAKWHRKTYIFDKKHVKNPRILWKAELLQLRSREVYGTIAFIFCFCYNIGNARLEDRLNVL
ncbi:hypothetical protein D7V86_21275 [bacterium D16-51]|nr:hypothetical protein D7V96_17520 [bacterium D16-59]RKI55679.1 hypothetical protein D7V86_21275 [bacterium D16-51]